jgi:hypothetical protein
MSRPLAGIACRIRVPVRQYQAVALLVGQRNHVIRLMHREVGLSLDVEEFESYATAEEYRERLADFLGLPSVIAAGTPSPVEALSTAQPDARRTRAVKSRRPRFLARRHAGHEITIRKVEGREIIARH